MYTCTEKARVLLNGMVTFDHQCTGHTTATQETDRAELGGRVADYQRLSDAWPRDTVLDDLERIA